MIEGLPRPADILDELGEKVIEQVGRLSTNGFDAAFDDMVRYHRFLLEAYGTKTDTGTPK